MAVFADVPQVNWLPDGKRLQMRHGPIDLIVEAAGTADDVRRAYNQAAGAFDGLLADLTSELDVLRRPVAGGECPLRGEVARSMWHAAHRFSSVGFVTPMIAVAGAVSDRILSAMISGPNLSKAYVNNGGDIALQLQPGQSFDIGVCANLESGAMASTAHITASGGVGGIATSGWRGRSHSLGIADAVTVLAEKAASADAAATLIANAIDLPVHPAIRRTPARELAPDSDLGARLVTVDVGLLDGHAIEDALTKGHEISNRMIDAGEIIAVFASLQGRSFSLNTLAEAPELRAACG